MKPWILCYEGYHNYGVERHRNLASDYLDVIDADAVEDETLLLRVEMNTSHVRIAEAARVTVRRDGGTVDVPRKVHHDGGLVAHDLAVDVDEGEGLTVEKVVAAYASRGSERQSGWAAAVRLSNSARGRPSSCPTQGP